MARPAVESGHVLLVKGYRGCTNTTEVHGTSGQVSERDFHWGFLAGWKQDTGSGTTWAALTVIQICSKKCYLFVLQQQTLWLLLIIHPHQLS